MNRQASSLIDQTIEDQGVLQVAPGIFRNEESVGANVTQVLLAKERLIAGLGDGRVVSTGDDGLQTLARHCGAVTGLQLLKDGNILSAGQDGKLLSISADSTHVLYEADDSWINAIAVSDDGSLVTIAVGKQVYVYRGTEMIASFSDHPSTVSGLAFFEDGARLAVSHYNGISIWSLSDLAKPQRLTWAGSVVSVSVSPNQRYIASATQDREIHVWDFVSGRDFRLGGYQRKVKSIGWTDDSSFVFTSGADVAVAWKMSDDPSAIPPVEIGYAYAHTVSAVAKISDPSRIAAGFSDGSIQIGEVRGGTAKIARPPGSAEVSAIDAPMTRSVIAYGTACGYLGALELNEERSEENSEERSAKLNVELS